MRANMILALALLVYPAVAKAGPDAGADAVLDGAFRDAQMVAGSRTALALSQSAARLAAGDAALQRLIVAREDAAKAASNAIAAEVAARSASASDAALMASTAQASSAARSALDSADAALGARFPGYAQLTGTAPLHLAEAQALLADDEAIVLIHSTETHSYTFAITRNGAVWSRADLGRAKVDTEASVLRTALDPDGKRHNQLRGVAPTGFPRDRAFGLYQALWRPIVPLIGHVRTVYVVTGGGLGGLPLATLPTQRPTGRDNDPAALRKTHWLVRDAALVTLPSVGSLRALRAGRGQVATRTSAMRPFSGFGDPLLEGAATAAAPRGFDVMRGVPGTDLVTTLRAFPRLPGAKAELDALAGAMGADRSTVITGSAATETAVRSAALGDVSVIAFATHGLLAGEIGPSAEPALVMTPPAKPSTDDDGLLTASEAAALHLSADWVVLSACNTASADGTANGEGLSGLVRGFFSGGARAVLASHWRVRDDVVELLTVGTIARWKAHPEQGRAEALQGAMLAMIDDRKHPEHADPSLWAPFIVAGEGR